MNNQTLINTIATLTNDIDSMTTSQVNDIYTTNKAVFLTWYKRNVPCESVYDYSHQIAFIAEQKQKAQQSMELLDQLFGIVSDKIVRDDFNKR